MKGPRPPAFGVRPARPEENQLLFELGVEAFSAAFGPANTPENMALYLQSAFSPERQAAELADPASVFLIAELTSQPVGYARLLEGRPPLPVSGSRPIEIVRIYPRPAWIGRGVGSALMHACLQEAVGRGCDTVWLGVWEKNLRAIAFYETWGFRRVGTHPFLLGMDEQTDWIMQRRSESGAR
jgi:diamine N-acetyltransferase